VQESTILSVIAVGVLVTIIVARFVAPAISARFFGRQTDEPE
jgi:hypothetical protein